MAPPLLGSSARWARDFAFLGGVMGFSAPFFVILEPGFAVAAGLAGAVTGAPFGVALGWWMERLRGTVPLVLLVAAAAVVGALWGGMAGAFGGLTTVSMVGDAVGLGLLLGTVCGGLTVGTGLVPYLVLSARGADTRPLLAVAALVSPVVGWLGLVLLAGAWVFALPGVAGLGLAMWWTERRAHRLAAGGRRLLR